MGTWINYVCRGLFKLYRFVYINDKDCNIVILYVTSIYYNINFIYMVVVCWLFNMHAII